MMPTTRRLAGVLAAAACAVAACTSTASLSGGGTPTTVATTTTVVGGSRPAETMAATLRAKLTALFDAHVYLTGVMTSTVVAGADARPSVAAVNTDVGGIGDIFTQAYGVQVGEAIIRLFTDEANALMAYAKAKTANNAVGASTAKTDVASFRTRFATSFSGLDVNVTKQALLDELDPELTAELDVVDAQVAKSPTQYDKLAVAADLMPHTADLLAAAIAKQQPRRYPGTTTGTAANLRAQLTSALVSHAYLVAITTATSLGGGDPNAPAKTLDANTQALANVFASTYGDGTGRQFAGSWASHIRMFRDYAEAVGAFDTARADSARAALSSYAQGFAAFVGTLNPRVTKDEVSGDFAGHIVTLLTVIDAQAARSTAQFDDLRLAGEHMPMLAELFSEAIAEQFPDKFAA